MFPLHNIITTYSAKHLTQLFFLNIFLLIKHMRIAHANSATQNIQYIIIS